MTKEDRFICKHCGFEKVMVYGSKMYVDDRFYLICDNCKEKIFITLKGIK